MGPAVLSAVEEADPDIIELIFSRGGDPNFAMAGGYTPIFVLIEGFELAVPKPEIKALRLLIKLGARLDVRDPEGLTPLGFAQRLGLTDLVPFLKELTEGSNT